MNYDGDVDKIIPDLPKLLNECAGVRSDSEAGLMGLAADEIERLRELLNSASARNRTLARKLRKATHYQGAK